ncbi:hypothetical protein [Phenylobacterium sp.]|uniref:tetratricopeptide repeat protein n=1 Tax=Phenylobacterium sp. TaxID=1871053 RepID=UPI0025FCBABC|nr:hypothetical protein [Phenylobacterium sp.]
MADATPVLPPNVIAAINYSYDLERRGLFEDAISALQGALRTFPGEREIEWRLGTLLMREGRFDEGLPLWERRPVNMGGRAAGKPTLAIPEWDGRPVSSLLILQEQGLGDQIMFARYAAWAQGQGIAASILCHPLLVRLFQKLEPAVNVVPGVGRVALPACDAWALGPSMPFLSGVRPSATYIASQAGGQGIGVMTTGRPEHVNDQNRSLPPELAAQVSGWKGARDLAPGATGAADFEDTRRIVEGLDVVVTVDTSVAHLAGAMGKPCFVMLPFNPDWRWMRDRSDSPWYPSIRLFRQPSPDDWASVVAQVREALDARGH